MSHLNSHSYFHSSPEEIKKGLERIKLAQLEVLKELRKEQRNQVTSTLKNQTDSIEAGNMVKKPESRNIENFLKERVSQLEDNVNIWMEREKKLRQQNLKLSEDLRNQRDKVLEVEKNLKNCEKNENQTLSKAEQALRSAIESEKKYITLKSQFDKIILQRDSYKKEVKKIQQKQLDILSKSQFGIYAQIAKDLGFLNELHEKLLHISSKPNSKKAQNKFQLQIRYENHLSNLLNCLSQGRESFPQLGNQKIDLSRSFREDIRKIEEEIQSGVKFQTEEKEILYKEIQGLRKENQKLIGEAEDYQYEIKFVKDRIKGIALELQEERILRKSVQQDLAEYKRKLIECKKQLENEKKYLGETLSKTKVQQAKQKYADKEIQIKQLEQKVKRIEQINEEKTKEIQYLKQLNEKLEQIHRKLKKDYEISETKRKSEKEEYEFELSRITNQIEEISSINMRDKKEWKDMVQVIRNLQEERNALIEREITILHKHDALQERLETEMIGYEDKTIQLQGEIEKLRRENSAINYERAELIRLRKKEDSQKDSLVYDKWVDELWAFKEKEYQEVNIILQQFKSSSSSQSPLPFRK